MTSVDAGPPSLDSWVGQASLIRRLDLEIKASIADNRALPSMVLYGAPGLGKTTLCRLVAKCRDVNCIVRQGSALIARDFDVIFRAVQDGNTHPSMLVNMDGYQLVPVPEKGRREWRATGRRRPTILVIDECESLPVKLFQSLQDCVMPDAHGNRYYVTTIGGRSTDVFVPDMTMVLVTNYMEKLTKVASPLISRCAISYRFQPYTTEQLAQIIRQRAEQMGMTIDDDAAVAIAERSCKQPRKATDILLPTIAKIIRVDKRRPHVDSSVVDQAMEVAGLDQHGINEIQREYMMHLFREDNKTLPLEQIANRMNESSKTVEQVFERDLFSLGFVTVASGRGRQLTSKGVEYCNNICMITNDGPGGMTVSGRY